MGIEGSEETPRIAPVDPQRADDDDDLIAEGEVLEDVDGDDLGDVDDDGELILNDDGIDVFDGDGQPIRPGEYERGPDGQPWGEAPSPFGGPLGANGPGGGGMMPLSEAVAAQAEMRKHAVLRPIQRALPRGRS